MALNYDLINKRILEQRKAGAPETEIQRRVNEIQRGIDAEDYQIPDGPTMADGKPAVGTPTPTIIPPDYNALRLQQAADLKADDAAGGTGKDRIIAYYNSFQPSDVEKEANKVSATQEKKILARKTSENILDLLEDLYFKGGQTRGLASSSNIPAGRLGGVAARVGAVITPNEQYETFKRTLESKRALLAKAAGDTGNLALQEQILAGKGIPDIYSTPEEAFSLFAATRQGLEAPESKRLAEIKKNYQAQGKSVPERIISGAGMDIKDAVTGVASIPEQYAQGAKQGKSMGETEVGMAMNAIKGMAQEGGKFVKDPVNYTIDNPVDVGLTFLGGASAFKGVSKAGKAAEVVPPRTGNMVKDVNKMAVRDKLATEFSTAMGAPDEGSVLRSEKIMKDAFRISTAKDPRSVARELETDSPKYRKQVDDYAKQLDQEIGMQSLDENVAKVMAKLSETSPAQANPQLLNTMKGILERQMKAGDLGEAKGVQGQFEAGTSFEKMNSSREYLNSGLDGWFANRKPVGTPTNDLNALKWEASKAIKEIMSEADKPGVFNDLIGRQHTILEAVPVLSKYTLKSDKIQGAGGLIRKGYESVRDRVILGTAKRGDEKPILPELTFKDGTPVVGRQPALMNKTGTKFVKPDELAPTTVKGESATQKLIRDKRTKMGNVQFRK